MALLLKEHNSGLSQLKKSGISLIDDDNANG